ncbi:MAG: hypothetical protein ABIG87_01100 [Patescibacteria group bacterium]
MNSAKITEKQYQNDLYLTFFVKKVERIVSVLYLLTSYFPESEILKWKLREQGVALMSDSVSLNKNQVSYKDKIFSNIQNTILEIISFLEVASVANLVSEMNIEIFKREFNLLLSLISNNQQKLKEQILPYLDGNCFKIKDKNLRLKEIKNVLESVKDIVPDKGHSKGQGLFSAPNAKRPLISNTEKKGSRRDNIMKLLSKGQKMTIKDISKVIGDCGSKTIQRELQAMMKEKIINKEGERRWSKYFLSASL